MPLVRKRGVFVAVCHVNNLVAVKGAALAVGGAVEIDKFCYCAAGVWGKVVVIFCSKHGVTSLSNE